MAMLYDRYVSVNLVLSVYVTFKQMLLIMLLKHVVKEGFLVSFLVWKFCGHAQFPHSFGRIARNSAGTVPFQKFSTTEN